MNRHPASFIPFKFAAASILLCQVAILSHGCSTGSSTTSHQPRAPQATVYFEEVADWSFEAAHPAVIDQATIKQIFQGLYIDSPSSSQNGSADGTKPMRAFSDEDIEYLAPLLARALSQAQPEYVVAFRLSSSAGSGSEPTAGTLYVKDQEVFVTLTAHQGPLSRPDSSAFEPDPAARTVSFVPESAGHRQKADPTIALGQRNLYTLAIDYAMLNKQPDRTPVQQAAPVAAPSETKKPQQLLLASAATNESTDSTATTVAPEAEMQPANRVEQELKDAQRIIARKEAKIDQLRRDLESMRQQLEAKDRELRQVKSKPASVKRQKRGKAELVIR